MMIELGHPKISVKRQCELIGLARSSAYYAPLGESAENLALMRLIDELYTLHPFYFGATDHTASEAAQTSGQLQAGCRSALQNVPPIGTSKCTT